MAESDAALDVDLAYQPDADMARHDSEDLVSLGAAADADLPSAVRDIELVGQRGQIDRRRGSGRGRRS